MIDFLLVVCLLLIAARIVLSIRSLWISARRQRASFVAAARRIDPADPFPNVVRIDRGRAHEVRG